MYIPHMEYNDISHGNNDLIPAAIEIGIYIWTSEDVATCSFDSQWNTTLPKSCFFKCCLQKKMKQNQE